MAQQKNNHNTTVVVLGASKNPERYSNMAVKSLIEHGYNVIAVNPSGVEIHGIKPLRSLDEITGTVDTLTMYINAARSSAIADSIINLAAKRIIFNPGTENPQLAEQCEATGIKPCLACTLVMLNTGQF
ncbi:MAG: CoA-binding protein [Victivallaceae bacterium]|nr:CoA-binding protein [Victivallaceae bacterium]